MISEKYNSTNYREVWLSKKTGNKKESRTTKRIQKSRKTEKKLTRSLRKLKKKENYLQSRKPKKSNRMKYMMIFSNL